MTRQISTRQFSAAGKPRRLSWLLSSSALAGLLTAGLIATSTVAQAQNRGLSAGQEREHERGLSQSPARGPGDGAGRLQEDRTTGQSQERGGRALDRGQTEDRNLDRRGDRDERTLGATPDRSGQGMERGPAQARQGGQLSAEFRTALQPYGEWRQHSRWGEVWIPRDRQRDWRPYTVGHWIYTNDYGWYWEADQSEADWGWVAYHYGRWLFDRDMGWVWVPGNEWAPAHVSWRRGKQHLGWAPLPPDEIVTEIRDQPEVWIFVRQRDFMAPNLARVMIPIREERTIIRETVIVNRTVEVRDRRFAVNPGIEPTIIAAAIGRPLRAFEVQPRIFAGTAQISGAVEVRAEDLQNRERLRSERAQARETQTTIAPAKSVPPPQPLSSLNEGRLGNNPPRAAQGAAQGQSGQAPSTRGQAPQGAQPQGPQGAQPQTPQGAQQQRQPQGTQGRGPEQQQTPQQREGRGARGQPPQGAQGDQRQGPKGAEQQKQPQGTQGRGEEQKQGTRGQGGEQQKQGTQGRGGEEQQLQKRQPQERGAREQKSPGTQGRGGEEQKQQQKPQREDRGAREQKSQATQGRGGEEQKQQRKPQQEERGAREQKPQGTQGRGGEEQKQQQTPQRQERGAREQKPQATQGRGGEEQKQQQQQRPERGGVQERKGPSGSQGGTERPRTEGRGQEQRQPSGASARGGQERPQATEGRGQRGGGAERGAGQGQPPQR